MKMQNAHSDQAFIVKQFNVFRRDYRHFICIGITLVSIAFGFLFPNSIARLGETLRDLCMSVAFYFFELLYQDGNFIEPTVLELPSWQFTEDVWENLHALPYTWEEFVFLWDRYWKMFFNSENFLSYWYAIGDFMYYFSRVMLLVIPFIALIFLRLNSYKGTTCNDRNKKSRFLRAYEKIVFKVVYPVISWCKDFVEFCKENNGYTAIWLLLWLIHFNIISIVIAFIAYYFYFACSWDIGTIYRQLLKLQIDVSPMVRFIPALIWVIIGVAIYNYICRSMAFTRLYHAEKCNRAFLAERGIVTTVYGEMGIGKTQMITSMALSAEIAQFDTAFEILLEKDLQFPNFPWQRFRDELRKKIDNRTIVDLPTCREWVRYCRVFFDRITAIYTAEEYREKRKKYKLLKEDYTFGYDYTHYRTTYNDELKITHLFEALEDYACAYLIFTVKTTLLFSNYSIRVDSILKDLGNMPTRNNDFLDRQPEMQEAYSHHAHIIDFDMLRLGRKMIKDNPKARRLSFGVFVVTEIDKEFKNMQELKEMKINEREANQKNDLHNACIMMSRHAAVVANRVFIRIIADLQRPEAWGAGGRELGEIIYISDKSELAPALPFCSPYWLCQGVFEWLKEKWEDFYAEYIENRCDSTLFTYLAKNIIAKMNNHYDKIHGLFGTQTLTVEIQSGRMDGEVKTDKWRLIMKKDRSRRYRTACLEAVFDSYEPNTMHIDDFITYAEEVGTQEENALQNSYFQNDIAKMKELNS